MHPNEQLLILSFLTISDYCFVEVGNCVVDSVLGVIQFRANTWVSAHKTSTSSSVTVVALAMEAQCATSVSLCLL